MLASLSGSSQEIVIIEGDLAHLLTIGHTKTVNVDQLVARVAVPGVYVSPSIPDNCRMFKTMADGTVKYVIQYAPREVVVRFQQLMGAVYGKELRVWFPWQTYIVIIKNDKYVHHQALWSKRKFTGPGDSAYRVTTPNMYPSSTPADACLGGSASAALSTVTDHNKICQLVHLAHIDSAYNTDLNSGSIDEYMPDSIKRIAIPDPFMGLPASEWSHNAATRMMAKFHVWCSQRINAHVDVLEADWVELDSVGRFL